MAVVYLCLIYVTRCESGNIHTSIFAIYMYKFVIYIYIYHKLAFGTPKDCLACQSINSSLLATQEHPITTNGNNHHYKFEKAVIITKKKHCRSTQLYKLVLTMILPNCFVISFWYILPTSFLIPSSNSLF